MTKDSNKKPIIIACSIIAAIIVVVIAAVLLLSNKGLNDNFFTSDGSKYVLSMDSDEVLGLNIDDYDLKKAHLIYFCSNEKVTDLKLYYVYEDEETANKAAEYIRGIDDSETIKDVAVDGRYVILTLGESLYTDMTAEDAKQQVEVMKAMFESPEWNEDEEDSGEEEAEGEVEAESETEGDIEEDGEDYSEEEIVEE